MSRKDEEIRETRFNVAIRAAYKCEVCHRSLAIDKGELAHKIPQRDNLIKKYTKAVIHHNMNLRWTCPGKCNDAASIAGKPVEMEKLADAIRMQICADAAIRIHVNPHLHKDLIIRLAKVASGTE